jgi:hypothetical protein
MVDQFIEPGDALAYGRSLWPFALLALLASLVTAIGTGMMTGGGTLPLTVLGLGIAALGFWATFMALGGALFKIVTDGVALGRA